MSEKFEKINILKEYIHADEKGEFLLIGSGFPTITGEITKLLPELGINRIILEDKAKNAINAITWLWECGWKMTGCNVRKERFIHNGWGEQKDEFITVTYFGEDCDVFDVVNYYNGIVFEKGAL
jgi:hypothetical protein